MITDKDEPIKKEAIELAEDFTDWMGASWPMCGGINATVKLADMASKRFKTAERLAKIEVLEGVKRKVDLKIEYEEDCPKENRVYAEIGDIIDDMIAELKEAILSSPVKEGKTDDEKLTVAAKALKSIYEMLKCDGGVIHGR